MGSIWLVHSRPSLELGACHGSALRKFAPLAVPAPSIDAPKNVEIVNVEMKRFVLDPMSRKYAVRLTELVAKVKVAVLERVVLTGGLATVEEGLLRLQNGDTGGKKLVIRM
jgi:hypothetical protein